jgi:aspartate carbamoyltransferase catalytic subunit
MSTSQKSIQSLYKIKDLKPVQIQNLIQRALQFKNDQLHVTELPKESRLVLLAFLEPSTRTRVSFEMAALRLGLKPVVFQGDSSTSVVKGESLAETIETLLAMRPNLLVVRHSGDRKVEDVLSRTNISILNAGNGVDEHPTQALLDAMTIFEKRGQIEGQKIVYVGDVEHSRVARSGLHLFKMLGAEVAVCSPPDLKPKTSDWAGVKHFESLKEATSWGRICIGLRIQKERHSGAQVTNLAEYIEKFRLDEKNLNSLADDGLIMHPGPFVDGQDLCESLLRDKRCVIHDQVTNGVYMRMAVIGEIFGISYT